MTRRDGMYDKKLLVTNEINRRGVSVCVGVRSAVQRGLARR